MNARIRADDSALTPRQPAGRSDSPGDDSGVQLRAEGSQGRRVDDHTARQRDMERVVSVTSAIADAVTADQVYSAIVDLAGAAVAASSGALWLREEDAGRATLVRSYGYSAASVKQFGTVILDDAIRFPVNDAITRAEPIFIPSQEELHHRYPHLMPFTTALGRRVACFPVIVDGRTLGGLAFTFDRQTHDDEEERRFLTLAVRYGGQAIERLRLLDAERRRRAHAEAAAARLSVLNRATRRFVEASADLPSLLGAVAEQVAEETAGACAVVVFADDEMKRSVAVHPPGEQVSNAAEALSNGGGLSGDAELARHHVVPLTAHGKTLGALCALRDAQRGAFTEDERGLLAELSERAALVVARTLLHDANRRARERAELLYGLARVVIGADGVEQVLGAALSAVERAVSAKRSAVLIADAEGVLRFRAFRGLSDGYRAKVEGHSPWPKDARSPEPVLVKDTRTAPALAHLLPALESEGIRALAFIPLVADARLVGKFMVYYDEPHELSSQELEVAGAIANHVAAAVSRLHAVSELHRTVRFNETFTAILGHDLRNPLGAIMTAAQLAMKRYDDERLQKPLGRIITSGQRMARMIDQLLDFTRVRVGGGLSLSPQAFDILKLLRQILDELDGARPGFVMSLKAAGDTVGEWDSDRLGQVFTNLIGNAFQHGAPGMVARVSVDGTAPDAVRIEVVNGGAIPEGLVAKLFDPMSGGDGRREKSQGLGLGLFITRQIVRAHGGTIEVQSSEAGETAFRVSLPRNAARAPGSH